MGVHGRDMGVIVANGQEAAMNIRVQGFNAAIHNFRKTSQLGNIAAR